MRAEDLFGYADSGLLLGKQVAKVQRVISLLPEQKNVIRVLRWSFPAGWVYCMPVCGVLSSSNSSSQCGHSTDRPRNVQSLQNQTLD